MNIVIFVYSTFKPLVRHMVYEWDALFKNDWHNNFKYDALKKKKALIYWIIVNCIRTTDFLTFCKFLELF